ncbi:hypothetical protein E2986_14114, partial [Frieseomelitta varia]
AGISRYCAGSDEQAALSFTIGERDHHGCGLDVNGMCYGPPVNATSLHCGCTCTPSRFQAAGLRHSISCANTFCRMQLAHQGEKSTIAGRVFKGPFPFFETPVIHVCHFSAMAVSSRQLISSSGDVKGELSLSDSKMTFVNGKVRKK